MLHGVVSVAILSVLVGVSGTDNEYKGTQFTFTNNCKNELSLIARINDQGDHELKDLQPFEQYVYNVSNEVCEHGNVRAGTSLEATLFEFSTCEGENKINSMVFFDGSIIAPTLTSKDCTDAIDCGGAVKQDPRFQRGLSLLKEHDYEAAVSIFEDLLKTKIELKQTSEALELAPIYYEYGNALLSLAEGTANVFGNALDGSEKDPGDKRSAQGQEEKETQCKNEVQETPNEENVAKDDLELAWEMLEVARVIYARHPEDLSIEKELARVYMRLGDLSMESENFSRAKQDYENSLVLNKKILKITRDSDTTPLADLYCCLAISCIYQDPSQPEVQLDQGATSTEAPLDEETEPKDPANVGSSLSRQRLEEEGLRYYVLAGRVMAENIHRLAGKCCPKIMSFVEDRIPRYNTDATSMKHESSAHAKGKRKQRQDPDLELLFIKHTMASVRQDFLALLKREFSADETKLLEHVEIYVELKEKVDGIREGFGWDLDTVTEKTIGTTTIGFEGSSNATIGSMHSSFETKSINILPVVKKGKTFATDESETKVE
ncbi:unnamed protein product [Albugo candida]|uniref:Tetratricopeptide SHNi-TPR domain-containing protein n=1 Tax=Albugo candida TaxID=65357 RepID=A0A024G0S2_9STRA|nr:unnamed protein product [Albugo candida]|eukprot:CCI40359.1 unnamed protein product [Albugo candida]